MGRRVHAEGKKERTEEKQKIKANTKDFSDPALRPHPSPTPSLPFVQGRNSQCGPFPLPSGCGAGQSPGSGEPAPSATRGASGSARGPGAAPGVSARRGERAPGGSGRRVPSPPSAGAQPNRAGQRCEREGGWSSARPRSCQTPTARCPQPGRDPARHRQRASNRHPPPEGSLPSPSVPVVAQRQNPPKLL